MSDIRKASITVLFLLASVNLISQQIKAVRDVGFWGGIELEKRLSRNFKINLDQQLRLHSNATKYDDYIIDIGGKYNMNKNFKIGANLRYTNNSKLWKEAENDYRYNFDLYYTGEISDKLMFGYRLRYQHEYVNLFSEYQSTNVHYASFRNRAKIKYEINAKHEGYLSAELFRLAEPYRDAYFNKLRFYLGDEINSRIGSISISLGYEQEVNSTYPLSFLFLRTNYLLKL